MKDALFPEKPPDFIDAKTADAFIAYQAAVERVFFLLSDMRMKQPLLLFKKSPEMPYRPVGGIAAIAAVMAFAGSTEDSIATLHMCMFSIFLIIIITLFRHGF